MTGKNIHTTSCKNICIDEYTNMGTICIHFVVVNKPQIFVQMLLMCHTYLYFPEIFYLQNNKYLQIYKFSWNKYMQSYLFGYSRIKWKFTVTLYLSVVYYALLDWGPKGRVVAQ